MKIVIVTSRFPHALGKPDSFTVYHLIKHFAERHEISLASFIEQPEEYAALPELQSLCKRVVCVKQSALQGKFNVLSKLANRKPLQVNYFANAKMQRAVDELVSDARPDLMYCHLMRTAEYALRHDIPRVLALQISHILNYQRLVKHTTNIFERMLYGLEYKLVQRYEPLIAQRFTRSLLISPFDRRAIDPEEKYDNFFFSPHGIDTEYFSRRNVAGPEEPEPATVVFPADFSPATNRDAARWLLDEIWPEVRKRVPEAKLILAGRNPPKELQDIAARDEAIEVTGFVPDIRPYIKRAAVVVDPVRACAGMQNKILSGLAMETPVVATYAANEGIQAREGQDILLVDSSDTAGFVDHVVSLLRDPQRCREMGRAGREYVTAKWTWEYHFNQLEELFDSLVAGEDFLSHTKRKTVTSGGQRKRSGMAL